MANEVQINGHEYFHLSDRSHYNNNYYQHHLTGKIIFEKCEELEGTFAFWECTPDDRIFLGRSTDDITTGVITIHPDWD